MDIVSFKTCGVCAQKIEICVENGIVLKVNFRGGCAGNSQAISNLVQGMPIVEVIKKLKGIDCLGKGTSCPDQLAKALEQAIKKDQNIA